MISKAVQPGDKVELIKKTLTKEEQPFISNIQEIYDDNCLVLSAPIENRKIVPLELNGLYYLCVYTNRGLYRCQGVVINRSKEERLYVITFKAKTKMQKYQRRQYYRLDCVLNFRYKDDDKDDWNKGIILDISGGGIRFSSNYKLAKDKSIDCHIQLNFNNEKKYLYITGRIVVSTNVDYDMKTYENRVEFENISNEDRETIIRFIFEEERKRRKKEKGM